MTWAAERAAALARVAWLVLEAEFAIARAGLLRGRARHAAISKAERLLAEADDVERRSRPY